jgi:hypothetical protein
MARAATQVAAVAELRLSAFCFLSFLLVIASEAKQSSRYRSGCNERM